MITQIFTDCCHKSAENEVNMKRNKILFFLLGLSIVFNGCSQPAPDTKINDASRQTPKTMTEQGPLNDTTSGRISIDEARNLALSKVPGASARDIHITGGYEDGLVLYQGEILFNNMEYDFEINGYTAEFTEWEVKPLHSQQIPQP